MSWWVYFATDARAGEADTHALAVEKKVLYRPTHTEDGTSLIPNVQTLRPGDRILLVYRGSKLPRARVLARIALPVDPVPGFKAIDWITGDLAVEMSRIGYPIATDGGQEVIRLEKAERCNLPLQGNYGGHNAIHRVDAADVAAVRSLIREKAE